MSMRIPQLGKSNNSNFDANNKLTHILALNNCEYQNFKLLDVAFDNALRINDAISEICESAKTNKSVNNVRSHVTLNI